MPFGRLPTLVWKKDPKAKPLPRVHLPRPDPPPPVPDQVSWRDAADAPHDATFVWLRNGVRSGWGYWDGTGWAPISVGDPEWDPQPTAYLHGKTYE